MVAGATGLIGGFLVKALLDAPEYSRVYTLTRRLYGKEHPKLANRVVVFNRMADQLKGLVAQDAFCCIGTTIKDAGSQEAFREADVDAVLLFARAARAALMKPVNSGCPSRGLEVNSGWNCVARNQG